jgi:hypothetical protein
VIPAKPANGLPVAFGGGVFANGPLAVNSSIVWGNGPDQIEAMLPVYRPAGAAVLIGPMVAYSDVQMSGGEEVWEGEGNINADPLFVDPEIGDFHLQGYSPCVNAGNPFLDHDANGSRADMGAFNLEFATGDVTMDGTISGMDASRVLQFSVRIIESVAPALADVTANGRSTAMDAALILRKVLDESFVFPADVGGGEAILTKLAIPTRPRTLTWERDGSAWQLRADDPDGVMAGEFTFRVREDVAVTAAAGEFSASNRIGGLEYVAFARAEFTDPVLIRLDDGGNLFNPPEIEYMQLNDGVTPILRVVRPVRFALEQNVPNPFNPTTTIRFGLPTEGVVNLVVYDITGRVVRTLVNGRMDVGVHAVTWDGRDAVGRNVASGTYVYRLVAPDGVLVKRMVMVK